MSWFILADDLTGAADCAIAFAKQGIASAVAWGEAVDDDRPPVLSYDADSRGLSAEKATARQREALGRFLGADDTLFKKIDSTLRGQPAAETVAAVAALRARAGAAFGILAPAFPATGRTTEGGQVLVGGRKLEETETWQREHSYARADLVEVLASAGIRGEKVSLAVIRSGTESLRAALSAIASHGDIVAVCDAVTQEDLDRIAAASLPASPGMFFIGSAGLAHALAAASPGQAAEPITLPATQNGTLVVVGSLAGISRAAARHFVATQAVRYLPVWPETLLSADAAPERAALGRAVTEGLNSGEDVLVEILMDHKPNLALGPLLADALATALQPAAPHIGGLAATGGETAAALLAHLGVNGIRLVNEIEPGVSLGLTLGAMSLPVVTKAGAFGDENSLARIAARLRRIRQEGVLA
jgi:uncharacterized protein YgbK (DUF1537 family)